MRRTVFLLLGLTAAAACSSTTGPKPLHDPFVVTRVVNDLDTSYAVYVRFPGNPVVSDVGVIDLADSSGRFGWTCVSVGSLADTTQLYLVAFRSTPAVSSGNFASGDSATMHTTGLVDPFVGQPGHGDASADPLRWLWKLSTSTLVPDSAQYALAAGDPARCRF